MQHECNGTHYVRDCHPHFETWPKSKSYYATTHIVLGTREFLPSPMYVMPLGSMLANKYWLNIAADIARIQKNVVMKGSRLDGTEARLVGLVQMVPMRSSGMNYKDRHIIFPAVSVSMGLVIK